MQFNLRVVFLNLPFPLPPFHVGIQPKCFHMVGYITFHIFKCKIHFNEEKLIYLPYENSKSPSCQPRILERPFSSIYVYSQKN